MVDTIDAWARRLPKTGPIEGALFNEGHGLALLLGDPEKLARHGAGQWAIQQADAPSTKEEDADTPTTEATRSVTDELQALFGDLDDPEPAAGAFESVEAPSWKRTLNLPPRMKAGRSKAMRTSVSSRTPSQSMRTHPTSRSSGTRPHPGCHRRRRRGTAGRVHA